jgi:hypothetical protein
MTFRVGQKVVCVDAVGQELFLRHDEVYVVDSISPCGAYLRVGHAGGHYKRRFRPIVERKTDITVFTKILRKATKPARSPAVSLQQR